MTIPTISKKDMRRVDELMVEKYKIGVIQMMEIAGFNVAEFARRLLTPQAKKKLFGKSEKKGFSGKIVILAGKGNNGGDGICAARYLRNWGANVVLFVVNEELKDEPLHHFNIVKQTGMNIINDIESLKKEIEDCDMIIDGLIGYNLRGNPEGDMGKAIQIANDSQKDILAIDVPSGVDADEGIHFEPAIHCKWTLCLSLPKQGWETGSYGETYVADMGVVPEVYKELNIEVGKIFKDDIIVRVE
tara:strand:- start:779 stop:1513 length:735 start_codon:yes stop_codon:yes gene_type:complete